MDGVRLRNGNNIIYEMKKVTENSAKYAFDLINNSSEWNVLNLTMFNVDINLQNQIN